MRRFIPALFAVLLFVPSGVLAQSAPAKKPSVPAAAASGEAAATKLPVKRVVLFKNGVGYFEHLGRVRGNQDVSVDFTSGQLNDVLKSLTALDLGSGRITGVNYNSDAPLSRRLAALRLPLGEQATVAQFLGALRGARIEVRSGVAVYTGRLLSIERKTRVAGGTTLEVDVVSLVTDGGELRTIELGSTTSVRILERELSQEVNRYMGLVASTRDRDLRRMTISTAGSGERPLFVSYISEVPVWKTTYRLVLPSKAGAKPLLQGWAIVDNTVGEDWDNVELSLVAGAPQSFIQNLSQPYYSRRPVVPLPESAQLTPQTHTATLIGGYGSLSGVVQDPMDAVVPGARVKVYSDSGSLVAETSTDDSGKYSVSDLPAANYRIEYESPGFNKTAVQNFAINGNVASTNNVTLQVGDVQQVVEVTAAPEVVETTTSVLTTRRGLGSGRNLGSGSAAGRDREPSIGAGAPPPPPAPKAGPDRSRNISNLPISGRNYIDFTLTNSEAAAQGQELGDLFEYKLKERVTIHKNQSALVPIVHAEIGAEKVSLWNESEGSARPLRALWLTNSSALTLDGGSFSVLEDETFAGEGLLDPLKPGEKRLLSYATDLGMLVGTKRESESQRVTRVRILRGMMIHTSEMREKKTYTVRNEDAAARTIVLEHPARPEWKLAADAPKPEESAPGMYRFRLSVASKKTSVLVVNETRPLDSSYQLTNLTGDQIALFLRQKTINADVEAALRRIVEQKNRVAEIEERASDREEERDKIYDDQQRLRENMKALKGSAEEKALLQRYTAQLNEQENRLDSLRKEMADLEAQRMKAQAELDKLVQDLTLDVTL
ncbi:MAG: carboxypeptidase regulatory-like domain-containing protein [Acidobacteria bacterium]|nr:carboxypeptidase regulatory-like domain-containing protein [Acidobacteriota bacterium]MCL5289071.1 carboxypeptidase regulatory-like domain-containing protein [Acidobacteriota bacterium]